MLHQSVLLNESIQGLAIKPDGIYIDGTFGRGGHSQAILKRLNSSGRLIAIDKDLAAIDYARQLFQQEPRVTIAHRSFADIKLISKEIGVVGQVDGVLLDLGVSSPQLDSPERGFSFMHSGPLDMRMDITQKLSAASFVNNAPLEEMIAVFRNLGEERFARRIANAIVSARLLHPITTTNALAEIVKAANPRWEKHKHPATRVFQAIRIFVNQELTDLTQVLKDSIEVLAVGGRLSVISFHSLEDRIVKNFMRNQEVGEQVPHYIPIQAYQKPVKCFKRISKAIKPGTDEARINNRSRSAVLRIGEKLA